MALPRLHLSFVLLPRQVVQGPETQAMTAARAEAKLVLIQAILSAVLMIVENEKVGPRPGNQVVLLLGVTVLPIRARNEAREIELDVMATKTTVTRTADVTVIGTPREIVTKTEIVTRTEIVTETESEIEKGTEIATGGTVKTVTGTFEKSAKVPPVVVKPFPLLLLLRTIAAFRLSQMFPDIEVLLKTEMIHLVRGDVQQTMK